ncbi:MAG: 50S ribosomal protein L17 [Patescibacteria group bacterium]|jgi:large subunit ribosomal protein L17
MRHNRKGKVLGREKAPREALLRSLVTSLVVYEKIKTTKAKAQVTRPKVEKLITLAKNDTLHNRREALKVLYTQGAVKKLFEVLGPKYKDRKGGYTRIVKLAPRVNDGAEVAIIEFI